MKNKKLFLINLLSLFIDFITVFIVILIFRGNDDIHINFEHNGIFWSVDPIRLYSYISLFILIIIQISIVVRINIKEKNRN